ncbi:MAG TPA: SRPBCC domain-containing protein [Gemmatimonadaceae bacterium]|nr:SRPBCC domain-containing protein [Gemmatimonadaceae bacterium]
MTDILQDFPIGVAPDRVYDAVSNPAMLDEWWTIRSTGQPVVGATYELDFGPGYLWKAEVTRAEPGAAFELRLTIADADWQGSTVGFDLTPQADGANGTMVRFQHRGWPSANEHFRVSTHCWAMYLRLLRRHLEYGERVPYDERLSV